MNIVDVRDNGLFVTPRHERQIFLAHSGALPILGKTALILGITPDDLSAMDRGYFGTVRNYVQFNLDDPTQGYTLLGENTHLKLFPGPAYSAPLYPESRQFFEYDMVPGSFDLVT